MINFKGIHNNTQATKLNMTFGIAGKSGKGTCPTRNEVLCWGY